jgi:hypothetical protein
MRNMSSRPLKRMKAINDDNDDDDQGNHQNEEGSGVVCFADLRLQRAGGAVRILV